MPEREHGRAEPLWTAFLSVSCVSVLFSPVGVLAVGMAACVLGRWRVRAIVLCLVAGISLAAGCVAAALNGAQGPLVLLNGSAGALTVALAYTLGRHLDDRERYREAGWRLSWALDSRRRAIDTEARAAERARIASEMHDSLGHDMALIAMRASALEVGASSLSPDAPPRSAWPPPKPPTGCTRSSPCSGRTSRGSPRSSPRSP